MVRDMATVQDMAMVEVMVRAMGVAGAVGARDTAVDRVGAHIGKDIQ